MESLDVHICYAKCASFLANWGFSGQRKIITLIKGQQLMNTETKEGHQTLHFGEQK